MPDQLLKNSLDIATESTGDSDKEQILASESGFINLDDSNYDAWSGSMKNLLKNKGWDQLIETPWHDGVEGKTTIWLASKFPALVLYNLETGEPEPLHPCTAEKTNEAVSRRECVIYIIKHIWPPFQYFCDCKQDDPYILWKEIEEFWNLEDFGNRVSARWCREILEMMSLEMGQSIADYLEEAKGIYDDLHRFGGSMSGQEFIDCFTKSLCFKPSGIDKPLEERLGELKEQLEAQEKILALGKAERDRLWLFGWDRERERQRKKGDAEEATEKENKDPGEKNINGIQGEGDPKTPEDSSSDSSLQGDSPSISIYFSSP
ncbi:hypothetical protein TWF751_003631 [Orbilia oligospora]|nr:hypothetical protein TWF751_003631 [Orbilia oligospora]